MHITLEKVEYKNIKNYINTKMLDQKKRLEKDFVYKE